MEKQRTYIAVDLKSFYASAECIRLGYDPLDVNLVVADESRTDKTICLAVSPAMKKYGLGGRPRLFEVKQKKKEINMSRQIKAGRPLRNDRTRSVSSSALQKDPSLAFDFVTAVPHMAEYIRLSTQIYNIYLRFVSADDIHVYSIDEVFIDATDYLHSYGISAADLAMRMILTVLDETKITATAGIGTNLYLAKIAMDIKAKHIPADENGVRIAQLDEMGYRKEMWTHRPLCDFWRVGRGYSRRLEAMGLYTMGDIARQSVRNEEVLYSQFGVNAELLIDHAWGWEPCTIKDIKAYRPVSSSIGQGQVLSGPYTAEKARLVISEMADMLSLSLLSKRLQTSSICITIGYDRESLESGDYKGEVKQDFYGRSVPKHSQGTIQLDMHTSAASVIIRKTLELYDRIVNNRLFIRRLNITALDVRSEEELAKEEKAEQLELFTDYAERQKEEEKEQAAMEKERRLQLAALSIKEKFGRNALLRAMSFEEGATARERNQQIGGHKA